MRSSRAERGVLAALAAAGVALGVSAAAQVGPPIRLGPPATQPAPLPKPPSAPQSPAPSPGPAEPEAAKPPEPQPPTAVEAAPAPQPAPTEPAPTPATASITPEQPRLDLPRTLSGIEVTPVGAIDPDSVGVLGPHDGGFGPDLWQGTERALVERLLPSLAGANGSPTMRALARRLLLTQGAAPTGPGTASGLLALRVERLIALGDIAGALDLVRAAPQRIADDNVLRGELESLFYSGDVSGACARIRAQQRDATPYLQRASTFCIAQDGDMARAAMVAGLLREQASDAGDPFFALIDALGGGGAPPVIDARDPTGLQLAMLHAAHAAPPAAAAGSPNGAVLRAMAFLAEAPVEVRLAAAERAYVSGVVTDDELIELYNAVGFPAERIKAPFAAAESEWGPSTRALLIRTAATQANPAARAETLQRALALAAKKGGRDALLRIGGIVVRDLDQGTVPRGFVPDAVRMLFAAGANDTAAVWMQRVQVDPSARDAAMALWPLAEIAGAPTAAWDSDAYANWLGAARKTAPDTADSRAALLVSLCSALGTTIPNTDWAAAMATDSVPRPAPGPVVLRLLSQAAAEKRVGETVLLALVAVGEGGPANAHPFALARAISALSAIGLDREARALALEAALTAGL